MRRGLLGALVISLLVASFFVQLSSSQIDEEEFNRLNNYSNAAQNISGRIYNPDNNLFGLAADKFRYKLLSYSFVSSIDRGLQKASNVFKILVGEPYSFSFAFFVVLIIWVYLWHSFSTIFSSFTIFSNLSSWGIGLGANIILAQTKLFSWIGHTISDLIFKLSLGWQLAILIIFILLLIYLRRLIVIARKKIRDYQKKRLEEYKQFQLELNAKRVENVINPLSEALTGEPAKVDERFRFDPGKFRNPSLEEDDGSRHLPDSSD
ncbi:hypothetical protein J4447_02705 [Candidatus Pacearchaeota archaeon]|nr:hypothetical protein [Candidatus Pacearchaeota archaeon]